MIKVIAKKKKFDLENEIRLLKKIKDELKTNEIALEICKEYGFDSEIIDGVPLDFKEDLEASAKTVDSRIYLNANLLDEDFDIIMRYAIHELVHALQHMRLKIKTDPEKHKDYLDREDELEAFQYQVEFQSDEMGEQSAKKYVDDLVKYHKLPEGKAEKKKKELLEKVQD